MTIAMKVANNATAQMEQRVWWIVISILFSHQQMNQYLKSAVPMQLNGGMVHDVVSCRCLYLASHTLMQYSVSFV